MPRRTYKRGDLVRVATHILEPRELCLFDRVDEENASMCHLWPAEKPMPDGPVDHGYAMLDQLERIPLAEVRKFLTQKREELDDLRTLVDVLDHEVRTKGRSRQ